METKTENDPSNPLTIVIEGMQFPIGALCSTPGATDAMQQAEMESFLKRHCSGDWGDCCEEDRQANDYALAHGGRVFSVYRTEGGERIWLITEADRSATTFLLPSEY